jgi:hypothetical protein
MPAMRLAPVPGLIYFLLDDDDRYYEDHLRILLAVLHKSRRAVVYSDAYRAEQRLVGGRWVTEERLVRFSSVRARIL